MSNLGRPLCQLECEQAGIKGINYDNNSITRNTFGDICEDIVLFLLHASGVPIVSEQEQVTLEIAGQQINGTLDVVIDLGYKCSRCLAYYNEHNIFPMAVSCCQADPRVWDIKSASDWSFKNKFTLSFDNFLESDDFGYVDQLFLYGEAKRYKAGGLIVQNKSTGEIRIFSFPDEQEVYRQAAMRRVAEKVDILSGKSKLSTLGISDADAISKHFNKSTKLSIPTTIFEPTVEYFYSKPTGNRLLNSKCTLCDYKFHCFPSLVLKPKAKSKAKSPEMVFYVEYEDD